LKELDAALFGGLPEGSVVSLESPPFDERDALAKVFLQSGLRQANAGVLITRKYGQVAELHTEFPTRFFGIVCGPEADLVKGTVSNMALVKNFENLTELNLELTRILDSIPEDARKTARCRLDILSDIMIRHGPVITRKWFSELASRLKARGFTTLVVFEPKMHEEKEQVLLAELFEGRIQCYEKTLQKKTNRFLRVVKMTDQSYHEDEIQLNKEDLKSVVRADGQS
jgi:KaiC/GvpD/RAD55 family RecA-like ATPase